jgi:hypothetical protein
LAVSVRTDVLLGHDSAINAGVELHRRHSADLPAFPGDFARLSQALHQLVDNACKFSPEGMTVTVSHPMSTHVSSVLPGGRRPHPALRWHWPEARSGQRDRGCTWRQGSVESEGGQAARSSSICRLSEKARDRHAACHKKRRCPLHSATPSVASGLEPFGRLF